MEELRWQMVCPTVYFTISIYMYMGTPTMQQLTLLRNHGDLAEGWYDPVTLRKARDSAKRTEDEDDDSPRPGKRRRRSSPSPALDHPRSEPSNQEQAMQRRPDSDSGSDDIGPAPLRTTSNAYTTSGPSIPSRDDLLLRDDLVREDHTAHLSAQRHERKLERKTQQERLDELAPRGDAGSRERQIEKRNDARASLASFREAKDGGDAEVGEGELMGDGGIDDYKRARKETERKKNEREIRREEIWRAKAAEREERMQEARAKEDKTMEYLKALAKERFG